MARDQPSPDRLPGHPRAAPGGARLLAPVWLQAHGPATPFRLAPPGGSFDRSAHAGSTNPCTRPPRQSRRHAGSRQGARLTQRRACA